MSKLISALIAAVFAAATITPVAFAADKAPEAKKEGTKKDGKKKDDKAKADEKKADKK